MLPVVQHSEIFCSLLEMNIQTTSVCGKKKKVAGFWPGYMLPYVKNVFC